MNDIDKALQDITDIRSQLAAGTLFQGVGPIVISGTGGLALITALLQSFVPDIFAPTMEIYYITWIMTAVIAVCTIGIEMSIRSPKHHACMSTSMILSIIQQFLPAGVAGAAIYITLLKYAPNTLWILPGIWQICVALGMFAAVRLLPATITWVGGWYLVSGVFVLILSSQNQNFQTYSISPWLMGGPFMIGQFAMAYVLFIAEGNINDED